MRCTFAYAVATALPLLTALGCGGTTPVGPSPASTIAPIAGPLRIEPRGNEVPLGQVHLRLDSDAGTAEAAPVRVNQAIGDAFLVGLSGINETCDCFSVRSVDREPTPTGARITLDVAFRHPFQLAQRPDLFGWDLKAIVATDRNALNVPLIGRAATGFDGPGIDGYTGEWTPQIRSAIPTLSAEVFPFAILGKDPAVVDPFDFTAPAGWNVFPSGGTNTGTLSFDLDAGETMDVDIFFTVGYQASATRPTRQTPQYMPPAGNSRAPWQVAVTVPTNDLSVNGGLAQLDIDIWDWQHGQSLGSDVTGVNVHAPELVASPIVATLGSGSGREADPLTASATIPNNLQTFVGGDAWALVEVVDALHGSNPGGTGGNPGQTLVEDDFVTIGDLQEIRTFQMVRLAVDADLPGQDPTAAVTAVPAIVGGVLTISDGTTVQYDASTSTDPDPGASPEGTIVGYEWDFEWDGVPANFVDDTAGSGIVTASHLYPTAGSTHLGLRVEDGVGRKSAILDVPITILDQQIILTLDPIVDLPLVDTNTRTELGPALTERWNGNMAVGLWTTNVTGNFSGAGWSSMRSGGFWGTAANSGIATGGPPNHGWVNKSAPTNDRPNASLTMSGYTNPVDNEPSAPPQQYVFGYTEPTWSAGIVTEYRNGFDLAVSQTTNRIFTFGDYKVGALTERQLGSRRSQTAEWGNPVFDWRFGGGSPLTVIDSRPSEVSRYRSAWGDSAGGIHVAYRSADGSQLRYAYDADGDNLNWDVEDIATGAVGEFKDPAFDQIAGKAYIAVARNTGGLFQVSYYKSLDNGATWSAPVNAGATFATEPKDLALSVRTLFGQEVATIGYTFTSPAKYFVRWSADGGSSWQDAQLSAGTAPGDFSGDLLQTRANNEVYGAWCGYDTGGRANVMVRRGVFSLQ